MTKVFNWGKLNRWFNIAMFILWTACALSFFADLLFFSESPPFRNITLGTLAAFGAIGYLYRILKESE